MGEILAIQAIESQYRLAGIVVAEPPEPVRGLAIGELAGRIREFLARSVAR